MKCIFKVHRHKRTLKTFAICHYWEILQILSYNLSKQNFWNVVTELNYCPISNVLEVKG